MMSNVFKNILKARFDSIENIIHVEEQTPIFENGRKSGLYGDQSPIVIQSQEGNGK
jgi:hypothetical protein